MIAAGAASFSSCDYDTLPTYNDVDRIYFDYAAWTQLELVAQGYVSQTAYQMRILFGYDKVIKSDSTIQIKMRIAGKPASIDRPVAVELLTDESSAVLGQDIEIVSSFIPADTVVGMLTLKLKNSEKMTSTTLLARLRLLPNEYFHVDYTDARAFSDRSGLEFQVFFDAKKEMPSLWAAYSMLTTFFGTYSNVKLDAICAACGFTREYFEYDPETESAATVGAARFPSSLAFSLILQVNHYLEDYKEAHGGQPLLDENGNEVKTSYPTWL
jgi:hypothetical protein